MSGKSSGTCNLWVYWGDQMLHFDVKSVVLNNIYWNDVLSTHHNYGGSFAKKSRFYNLRSENRWNSPTSTLRQLSWVVNLGISTHQTLSSSATNLPAPQSYNYMSSVHPLPFPLPFIPITRLTISSFLILFLPITI